MPIEKVSLDELCAAREDGKHFQPIYEDEAAIENAVAESQLRSRVKQFIAGLSKREQFVAKRIYWDESNQTRTAEELGVSRPMVAKILVAFTEGLKTNWLVLTQHMHSFGLAGICSLPKSEWIIKEHLHSRGKCRGNKSEK